MNKIRLTYLFSVITFLSVFLLTGCFTGIESTKKIKMSREEKRNLVPTAEEQYFKDIHPQPHTQWQENRPFIVIGDRGSILFEPRRIVSGNYQLSVGDTIYYLSSQLSRQPDGTSMPAITFRRGDDEFRFIPTGRPREGSILSDAIPGLLDPQMLEDVRRLMIGNHYWTRNTLRENEDGVRMDGKRFEKVEVLDVAPGNMIFPLRLILKGENGEKSQMLINMGNTTKDSRSFANMLQLTDPRKNYPSITDKFWSDIKQGKVEIGMNREECRLAKGNPSEVNSGHDYQHTLIIWSYPDGNVFYFVDGILQGINSVPK